MPPSSQSLSDLDATLAGTGGGATAAHDALALEPGQRLGRYVLLEEVGRGAAGRVFAAFDEELDRRIALKLVTGSEAVLAPAKQEAQAMAKISHPHVVVVHDVGTFEGGVFIAMEYLRGGTLADRMQRKRPVRDTLQDFVAAGQGLAAAHAAGLVHRDFKPTNVLFDAAGRPKVADFGLAVSAQDTSEAPGVAGTPAYMAPEQFSHRPVDARTDQFSFCAALHEALWGTRPFGGDTLMELATSVLDGKLADVSRGGVPPRVRRAVLRALSRSPEERFASMEALLRELDPDRRARTVRRTAVFGVAGATLIAAWTLSRPSALSTDCDAAAGALDEVWSPAVAASIRARAESTSSQADAPYLERTLQSLDEHARAWTDAARRACQLAATDPSVADEPRRLCLHRSRTSIAVLAEAALEHPEVLLDIDVTRGLRDPNACLTRPAVPSLDALLSDPTTADEVFAAAALAERSAVQQLVGNLEDADAIGDEALAAANALDSPYLIGRAQLARGRSALSAGDTDRADALLSSAFERALAADDPRTSALAAERLVDVYIRRNDAKECERWYGIAEAAQARLGTPPSMRVSLAANAWDCPLVSNDDAAAEAILRDALPYAALAGDEGQRGDLLFNLASLATRREQLDEVPSLIEEAAAVWGDRYPASHRRALALMDWRITMAEFDGRLADALALLEEKAEVKARSRGDGHPEATYDEVSVALYAAALGKLGLARARLETVEALHTRSPERVSRLDRALVSLARGVIAETEGDPATAAAIYLDAATNLPEDEVWLRSQLELARVRALVLDGRTDEAQRVREDAPLRAELIQWQEACWLAAGGDRRPGTLAILAERKTRGVLAIDDWELCGAVAGWANGESNVSERQTALAHAVAIRPGLRHAITFLARQLEVDAPSPPP